jgi:hypothetical protein
MEWLPGGGLVFCGCLTWLFSWIVCEDVDHSAVLGGARGSGFDDAGKVIVEGLDRLDSQCCCIFNTVNNDWFPYTEPVFNMVDIVVFNISVKVIIIVANEDVKVGAQGFVAMGVKMLDIEGNFVAACYLVCY